MSFFPRLMLLSLALCLPLAGQEDAPRTVIDADSLEMQGTDDRNYFYFRGNVRVVGEELEIRCQELVVTASRGGDSDGVVGEIGAIESIVASGDVHITQAGRQALAGRAEVNPRAGTVTLSENPRIIDSEVEVEGFQFVFHSEDRRVETIPDPDATPERPSRSRVTLSNLPAMGFSQPESQIGVRDRITPKPEDGGQMTEDGSRSTEDGGQVTEEEEEEMPTAADMLDPDEASDPEEEEAP